MPTYTEDLAGQILERRTKIDAIFSKKNADGKYDITAEQRDQVRALNDELNDLTPKWETARNDEIMEQKNREALDQLNQFRVPGGFSGAADRDRARKVGHDGASLMDTKSIGERFLETKSFTEFKIGNRATSALPDFDTKTLFQTSAGFDPFVPRLPRIQLSAQQQPKIVDLLPTSETTFHSIKWMLETTYTNAAAATAEGGAYPEAALVYTEQMSSVQKLSVFIPVTDEQFDDAPRTRDLVNNRLGLMLRQYLDQQLASGTGTSPQLKGLTNISGIQTQAKGTDPVPSAVYKAMTAIRFTAFSDPSGILMNPLDWQGVKLLQTADGLYIWGHPSADSPDRLWGLPVVQTTYIAQGTGFVADFAAQTELIYRKGIEFQVSNSHSDFFTSGKQAIRADMRAAFIVYRPAAICSVTGM